MFWNDARSLLADTFGQKGMRNRQRLAMRKELAAQLGLNHRTLKSFLNGSQVGLGAAALNRLFDFYPTLKSRYMRAAGLQSSEAPAQQIPLAFDR